jgi:predicted phosphodiesterase
MGGARSRLACAIGRTVRAPEGTSHTLRHEGLALLIQLASDLHLEFFAGSQPRVRHIKPAVGADLLVLAGDIDNGVRGVEAFVDWPVPVVYVAGNHEFYDHHWTQTRQDLRSACAGTCVTLLDNDAIEIGGVRLLGCTLWTDFDLPGSRPPQAMAAVERGLTDYRVIHTPSGPLRTAHTLADHRRSRAWLEAELARPHAGPTVVVTHHGPHPLSIHPRFAANPLNPGFVSDLTPLMAGVDLWLHGHTHDSFDYRVGRCRVLANPAGYVMNWAAASGGSALEFENARFEPGLVVEVGT